MDFVRLGPRYSTAYLPDKLIEGYNSLIWTERFGNHGEFQLKSFDVDRLKQLLPEDTLVSHLETEEVMMVETLTVEEIGEGEDLVPEITIVGRSATKIFEERFVEAPYGKKRTLRREYTPTSAAAVLIKNSVDNNSGFDLTRGDDDPDTEGVVNSYDWNTKDAIPNVTITDSVLTEGEAQKWHVSEGILYPQLVDIMAEDDVWVRCLRPVPSNSAKVITVDSALATRGTTARVLKDDITAMRFDLYSGIDRTETVKFSLLQGHLNKPQYLTSSKDFKTAVEVKAGEGVHISDIYREDSAGFTGWERRVMEYDAGSPELPPEPERPKELRSSATDAQKKAHRDAMDDYLTKYAKWEPKRDKRVADFKLTQTKAAGRALKKQRKVEMFSGDVSDLAPYTYKIHYDLGDTVMLYGEYGYAEKMVISEFVRTEDVNGDRGFPGLVAP